MSAVGTTTVGRIHTILDSLIEERRRLRTGASDGSLLEANRLAIVYWREQLERSVEDPAGRVEDGAGS
jgi:hypothetical protein